MAWVEGFVVASSGNPDGLRPELSQVASEPKVEPLPVMKAGGGVDEGTWWSAVCPAGWKPCINL